MYFGKNSASQDLPYIWNFGWLPRDKISEYLQAIQIIRTCYQLIIPLHLDYTDLPLFYKQNWTYVHLCGSLPWVEFECFHFKVVFTNIFKICFGEMPTTDVRGVSRLKVFALIGYKCLPPQPSWTLSHLVWKLVEKRRLLPGRTFYIGGITMGSRTILHIESYTCKENLNLCDDHTK